MDTSYDINVLPQPQGSYNIHLLFTSSGIAVVRVVGLNSGSSWLPFRPWPSGGRMAKTTPTGNRCPVDAE